MEKNQVLHIMYSYTNESGYDTTVSKYVPNNWCENKFELLVEEFKAFLLACGFHPNTVKLVQIVD